MFRNAAVRTPSLDELTALSKTLKLHCGQDELKEMREYLEEMFGAYQVVNDLVAPTLPVKYVRTPGYRPEPDDNKYNAWYWKCDIHGAAEGLLKGKRIGIKDSMCVAGVPMTCGSAIMSGYTPDIDATVVSCGEIDMAVGNDTGGSILIPSSWCGIVGLKPTFGLVPYTGTISLDISLDHVGPMANTVTDCALLLEAIAGYDGGHDPRKTPDVKGFQYSKFLDADAVRGMKIGLVTEGFEVCDTEVASIVRTAAHRLFSLGAKVEDASIPLHKFGPAIWIPIGADGTYQCMFKGNGAGYFYKGYYPESLMAKLSDGYATKTSNISDPLKMLFLAGEYIEKNYGNRFYGRAQNLGMKLTAAYNTAFEKYDVLVMPTLPFTAPLLPRKGSTLKVRLQNSLGMLKNTSTFNITGHPALSMNAETRHFKLPVGLMIVGKHFGEMTVFNVAYALEKLHKQMLEECNAALFY